MLIREAEEKGEEEEEEVDKEVEMISVTRAVEAASLVACGNVDSSIGPP